MSFFSLLFQTIAHGMLFTVFPCMCDSVFCLFIILFYEFDLNMLFVGFIELSMDVDLEGNANKVISMLKFLRWTRICLLHKHNHWIYLSYFLFVFRSVARLSLLLWFACLLRMGMGMSMVMTIRCVIWSSKQVASGLERKIASVLSISRNEVNLQCKRNIDINVFMLFSLGSFSYFWFILYYYFVLICQVFRNIISIYKVVVVVFWQ